MELGLFISQVNSGELLLLMAVYSSSFWLITSHRVNFKLYIPFELKVRDFIVLCYTSDSMLKSPE